MDLTSPVVDPWRAALLESSLDCVIVMDAAGILVDINRGVERTFGFTRDAVIGRRLGDVFVPEELRARHEAGLRRYLETRESTILGRRIEVEALHADGHRVPVELSIVHLPASEPPLFVGHIRNITDRLRRERRLRVSAAASRALTSSDSAESAVGGVLHALGEELQWPIVQLWEVDPTHERLEIAVSWAREGFDTGPFQGVRVLRRGQGLPGEVWRAGEAIWIADLTAEAERLPRWPALRATGVRSAVGFPVHVGGRFAAVVEAFAMQPEPRDDELLVLLAALGGQLGQVSADQHARLALARSETALREALEKEAEARLAAEQANTAKDQFLAVVSHELRTPLGPIMGWARLLQNPQLDGEKRQQAAEAILRNAALESRLVEDLLDVSRIVTGKLEIERLPVSVTHVVNGALESSVPAARTKGIDLRFDGEFDAPLVTGDPRRLQQVVSNLLVNAVKFTPSGGTVVARVSHSGATLEIRVSDSGEGIEAALLPHIFERFRQAPQHAAGHTGGLGLGLAIVQDIVRAHGGTVHAESAGPGRGATFTVRLPL